MIDRVMASRIVLQKMSRDIKGPARTSTYAARLKRLDTNLTCPRMSPLPAPSIYPFLMMFIVSYPLIIRRAVLSILRKKRLAASLCLLALSMKSIVWPIESTPR
jgi:hypothetical protein